MGDQLSTNADALRLFFTEDIYLVPEPETEKVMTADFTDGENKSAAQEIIVRDFKFLGKNQRNILILVNDSVNDVSTEKGNELLRNIVKAINLTAGDFALLNYSKYSDVKYPELSKFFSSNIVFSFGVSALELGLELRPLNEVILLEDTRFIFSSNLDQLSGNQQGKKMLWNSLKQLPI